MKLTMSLIKVVHLYQYSNKKTNFRQIKLYLENWHQKFKSAVFFDSIKSKGVTRYQKMFIWMQKFIDFNLLHYEIPQLSSC